MKKIFFSIYVLILCFNLYCESIAQMRNFASELMDKGEYYRAITEFMRINSYYPDNSYYIENMLMIARIYSSNDYKLEAINEYRKINEKCDNWEAKYQIPKLFFDLRNFTDSEKNIDLSVCHNTSQRDSMLILLSLNKIFQYKLEEARITLSQIKENQIAVKYLSIIDTDSPIKFKSRKKAALMGLFFPGSGYIYTQKPQTGVSALFFNGLLGYATYDCFKNNKQGIGYVAGLFTLSFHLGSVYGSIQSVNQYNERKLIEFTNKF